MWECVTGGADAKAEASKLKVATDAGKVYEPPLLPIVERMLGKRCAGFIVERMLGKRCAGFIVVCGLCEVCVHMCCGLSCKRYVQQHLRPRSVRGEGIIRGLTAMLSMCASWVLL
jgi:hypothetical protein